jgi:low affinity Fe/Cu permease
MANSGGYRCSWFTRFANWIAKASGHPLTFAGATLLIVVWAASWPLWADFDTWQLVINTATTIITFLMVFLIQNTQNRDTHAIQIKLDELIHSSNAANNAVLDVEELDEADLNELRIHYQAMAKKAVDEMRARRAAGYSGQPGRENAIDRMGDAEGA